jgi:threonine 3-dehydrogenase
MKVLKKIRREPGLWMEEEKIPQIGPWDVLIKIKKTAICGTDIHIYNWDEWSQKTIPTPLVIGHEFSGVVEKLGSSVRGLKVGARVSGEGHITCGYCRNCRAGIQHLCRNTVGVGITRPGCFAEYVCVPASNVFPIPDDISGEAMAASVAKHAGARNIVITDVNEYRLALAKEMGASVVVNPTKYRLSHVMKDLGMTEGFDVGMEMSGNSSAFNEMLDVINNGGKIALLGIFPGKVSIDWGKVIFKGLILKGIYGREMYETWYKMTTMVQSGLDIRPIITHRFSVDDFKQGFEVMKEGKSGKIILDWEC